MPLTILALSLQLGACIDGDEEDGSGSASAGGSGGQDPCLQCEPGENYYNCVNNGAVMDGGCGESPGDVSCAPGTAVNPPQVCDNHEADTDPNWDPGLKINYNATLGVYDIDTTFFAGLVDNPFQILHDDARVAYQDPCYHFRDVASGDFFDELGFQGDDVLISISGHPLADYEDAVLAAAAVSGNTSWSVVIYRPGTGYMTLYYRLRG